MGLLYHTLKEECRLNFAWKLSVSYHALRAGFKYVAGLAEAWACFPTPTVSLISSLLQINYFNPVSWLLPLNFATLDDPQFTVWFEPPLLALIDLLKNNAITACLLW
jgi:hypothetical protein